LCERSGISCEVQPIALFNKFTFDCAVNNATFMVSMRARACPGLENITMAIPLIYLLAPRPPMRVQANCAPAQPLLALVPQQCAGSGMTRILQAWKPHVEGK
jgi:hypothetical protein